MGGEQRPGARVIPRNLGNVRNSRTERGRVAGIPIGSVGAGVRVAEIGTADGNVVGSRSEGVDTDAVGGFGHTIVAPGRAAISCGNENRDALRHRLLIGRVVSGVRRSAVDGLALAVADAHDGRWPRGGVDQVLDSNQTAERGRGIRASGHLDGRAGCRSAGPLRIEDGFRIVRREDAGSAAVVGAARRRRVDLRE